MGGRLLGHGRLIGIIRFIECLNISGYSVQYQIVFFTEVSQRKEGV